MILDTLRMWWMFTWRFLIFLIFVSASNAVVTSLISAAVVAIILRVILGVSIFSAPLFKLARRRDAIKLNHKWFKKLVKTSSKKPSPIVSVGNLDESHFSPRNLENVSIPNSDKMFGTPGAGLSSSNFDDLNISLGQAGEENFSKALSMQNHSSGKRLIDSVQTFWSVAMPSAHNPSIPDAKFETDIDCVAIAGSTIYLIDLKFYESGGATYTSYGDDLKVHGRTSKTIKMTRNMAMAQDRFKKAFPNAKIESRVVFVPTTERAANLNNVYWPGQIPAVNLSTMLNELTAAPTRRSNATVRNASKAIRNLLKD